MGLYDRTYLREDEEGPEQSGATFDLVRDLGAAHWIIILCVLIWVANFFTDRVGYLLADGRIIYQNQKIVTPEAGPEFDPRMVLPETLVWRWLDDQLALKTNFYETQPWALWRLVTYAFVHSPGIVHLLFNSIGLWMFGKAVEERLGARGMWIFYLVSILVGATVAIVYQLLLTQIRGAGTGPALVLERAAGVAALAVLFGFVHADRRVVIFPFPISLPAWGAALLYLGVGIIWSLLAGDATGLPVHLAGMACGLAVGVTRERWQRWIPRAWTAREDLKLYQDEGDADELPEEEDDYGYAFQAKPDEQRQSIEREADRLLDKVHREGTNSLTDEEKRTLEDYSRQMREKRRH